MLDLIGAPFLDELDLFGSSEGDQNYIWHFVFDGEAAKNWGARVLHNSPNHEKKTRPEYMFEVFKESQEIFAARTFINAREVSGWEEEYGWTEDRMLRFIEEDGFEENYYGCAKSW